MVSHKLNCHDIESWEKPACGVPNSVPFSVDGGLHDLLQVNARLRALQLLQRAGVRVADRISEAFLPVNKMELAVGV